ncbi:MAG: Outer membrane porin F precursor [Acidobacteria bacterium ADurb.Bin340]|nr:MAG: Outer membrane porin F precursor [Acidobacteria bacterium ADurb.Bin340]
MKNFLAMGFVALVLAAGTPGLARCQDEEGCKDHPIVTRMPQFRIASCETKEFEAFEFKVGLDATTGDNKVKVVEGRYTQIVYALNEGAQASPLQVFRNHEQAFQKLRARVYKVWQAGSSYNYLTAVVSQNGKETWVMLEPSDDEYKLNIVELQTMAQQVTANALLKDLNEKGSVSLYINFDSGKSVLKEDGVAVVAEIEQALKQQADLKISIEGHTDNTGTPVGNRKLSGERAAAVVAALKARGIEPGRLASAGRGQDKPIADNGTEEGRAKNRRVEIVKR